MLRSRGFGSLAPNLLMLRRNSYSSVRTRMLPTYKLLEEEGNPDYNSRRFYPARVGETIHNYQIVSKLGWGTGSTVWLARDVKRYAECL